ncbi:putative tRNA-His guanylyltransferase protein [Rhizobium phage RHph_I1_18]|nr:putative tRNA-His guanylyltransferase protein [Rhizobium phage RHph_I1_18]
MKDSLGDEMKRLEAETTLEPFTFDKPIYARVDGRAFHTLTKRIKSSEETQSGFLEGFTISMMAGMKEVMEDLHADVAYVQSDEASFGWFPKENELSQHPFDGKVMKLNSVIASAFTGNFLFAMLHYYGPWRYGKLSFDCRMVDVKNTTNLQRMFYWRYLDARRNAISMFARQHWSQRELNGVKTASILEKIDANDNVKAEWGHLDRCYKEGLFFIRGHERAVTREQFIAEFERKKDATPLPKD